jgi:hypothetical protein
MIVTKQVEPTSLQTVDLSGRLCRTFEKKRLELEDFATFEKNVSLLSFSRKDLFQVAFKCFCSFKAEKQFIPQIGELEDCATFEKKCFHAIILQKKLLLSPFQMLLFLNSKKKTIYSTNKFTELIHVLGMCFEKKMQPEIYSKG